MKHVLSNGSIIYLLQISRQLFQPIKTLIDGQLMQLNEINTSFQQCLPFLHASGFYFTELLFYFQLSIFFSGGKIQVNPDKSIILEGHIFILNSIHSFLINKSLKQHQTNLAKASESFDLRSGPIHVKVMIGKLLEQNVDGVM